MAGPRIIAGQWRGKILATPAGLTTRPTNARARQAAFDILLHAAWAGSAFMQTARVLDVFAGTGAFGLEALSRGAAFCSFIENDRAALSAIRANIAACRAEATTKVFAVDALKPLQGLAHDLVFMDPPYGRDLAPQALGALQKTGWITEGALIVAELGPEDEFAPSALLAERNHGKARLVFWRV